MKSPRFAVPVIVVREERSFRFVNPTQLRIRKKPWIDCTPERNARDVTEASTTRGRKIEIYVDR